MTEEESPGTPSLFEEAFKKIHVEGACEQVWKQESTDRSLEELLRALGHQLNLDLSNAAEWFKASTHSYDPEDILTGVLTLQQFKRRTENYLLFQTFQADPHTDLSAPEYIQAKRSQYEANQDAPEELSQGPEELGIETNLDGPQLLESAPEPEHSLHNNKPPEDDRKEPDETDSQAKMSKVLGEEEEEDNLDEEAPDHLSKHTPLQGEQSGQPSVKGSSEPPRESWIAPLLHTYANSLADSFHSFGSPDRINLAGAKHCFKDVLNICKLSVPESGIADFYAQLDKRQKESFSYNGFLKAIDVWACAHPVYASAFVQQLALTVAEYTELSVDNAFHSHLLDLQTKLSSLSDRVRSHDLGVQEDSYRKGIEETFRFYAKALRTFGKKATFDQIESNNSSWNISKFMKFCSEFKLLQEGLSKETLTQVFKKCAVNTLLMHLPEFIKALDLLSELFYSSERDRETGEANSHKPLEEKRILFYKHLGFRSVHPQKLRGFGLPFSHEKTNFRIDPNNQRYQFRVSESRKQQLEQWRQLKKTRSEARPEELKPVKRPSRELPRLPVTQGYSKKVIRSSVSTQVLPTRKPLSFADLGAMPAVELPRDLFGISDRDDDVLLNQLYGSLAEVPEYSHVVKIHNNVAARGLKVIQRNRPRGS